MKLQELVANGHSVRLKDLAFDPVLAGEIQTRLIRLGCLDGPADGDFGPVSTLVLRLYAKQVNLPLDDALEAPLAESLLDNSEDTFLPLSLGGRRLREPGHQIHAATELLGGAVAELSEHCVRRRSQRRR